MGQAMDTDAPQRPGPGNIDVSGVDTNAPPRGPAGDEAADSMPKGTSVKFADGTQVLIPPAEEHAKRGGHGFGGAEATSHAKKRSISSPYSTPVQSPT
ncbi:hypothetical protein EXIGLDRAFT_725359 [Exidia glandulosa HHB12029]|uniref:Uncharacterized protein n=1 Tax=Exidia glandulosa HHB12029 TaxID=1314781 RepID=A0A165MKJ9_EXIGL|nr:hypothetical protein EXIGLDRAFT_725359 [Exidia glandulosa HHB12029]